MARRYGCVSIRDRTLAWSEAFAKLRSHWRTRHCSHAVLPGNLSLDPRNSVQGGHLTLPWAGKLVTTIRAMSGHAGAWHGLLVCPWAPSLFMPFPRAPGDLKGNQPHRNRKPSLFSHSKIALSFWSTSAMPRGPWWDEVCSSDYGAPVL